MTNENSNRLRLLVESAWLELPNAKTSCLNKEPSTIQEGGISNYFCYLKSFSNMKQISNLLGVPVFLSGPHSESELVTTDLYSFGFYHPDFPVRLRRYFIPAVRDHAFRSITQRIYDNSIKKTARTFFSVYHKLASNPEFFAKETSRYSNLVVSKRLEPFYLYKFILFMQPGFTDGEDVDNSAKFRAHKNDDLFDELLVKQVIGFWMRRRIDGTEKSFLNGLHDLLEIYDLEFYKERLK